MWLYWNRRKSILYTKENVIIVIVRTGGLLSLPNNAINFRDKLIMHFVSLYICVTFDITLSKTPITFTGSNPSDVEISIIYVLRLFVHQETNYLAKIRLTKGQVFFSYEESNWFSFCLLIGKLQFITMTCFHVL